MKILDGAELADYVKERQAKQVRNLRQAWKTFPKLAIIVTGEDPASLAYARLKTGYGEDILIDVETHSVDIDDAIPTIKKLNGDESVHGIIVQLPLSDPSATDEVLATIAPQKDVDGLGPDAQFDSATAVAIDWLLAGYNVELQNRPIAILGNGRLVGAPLYDRWTAEGYAVEVYDENTPELAGKIRAADVLVSAAGAPGVVTPDFVKPGAVIVDAGVAVENGALVGDVADSVRERQDLTITPKKGGVGPLTVAALFDAVIQAARATVQED